MEILALRIADRLKRHKSCVVFENELDRVWPTKQPSIRRIPLIEKFARKHGWSVTIYDPGMRATFARPGLRSRQRV